VARIDAELAGFTGQRDELGLAREDRLFCGDHVDVNGVCHLFSFAGLWRTSESKQSAGW
jgi:hypothetical protein